MADTAPSEATLPDALSIAVQAAATVVKDRVHFGSYDRNYETDLDLEWLATKTGRATLSIRPSVTPTYYLALAGA